jgi:Mg-chelatase subunit ChlD
MEEDREQARAQPRRPQASPIAEKSNLDAGRSGAVERTPIGRRAILLGLLGAGVAAGLANLPRLLSHSSLPEPVGQAVGPEYLAATLAAQPAPTTEMPLDRGTWSDCHSRVGDERPADLDLVLAIDTTGSMGRVIGDVKQHVAQLLGTLRSGGGTVRVGLVAYRDRADVYITRSLPMTELTEQSMPALTAFISGLQAAGGNDWPEKLDSGLEAAIGMDWRGDVPSAIVIIADAPAHREDEAACLSLASAFSNKIPGGRVSVVDTGSGANRFMRGLPRAGGGQYVTYDGHILKSLYPAITGCSQ